jgi:6-phosphogluconolactonase
MPPGFVEFSTRDALMAAAAERIAAALQAAIAARGAGCAALSGGSTPAPAYRALATMELTWPNITFALVDERFVPPAHPASNQAMVQRALAPAFAAGAQFAPMYAEAANAEAAAQIADALYAPLRIDVALMGMGADGHTASWFSNAHALDETLDLSNPHAVIALSAPQAEGAAQRLTLTRAALSRAGRILLLITGEEKRARLEHALQHNDAPVGALFEPAIPGVETLWAP